MKNAETETKEDQIAFFTKKAEEWDHEDDHNRDKIDLFVSKIGINGNERILDVATGIGILIPSYEKYLVDGTVMGIDYTPNMIAKAKKRYPKAEHPNIGFDVMDLYQCDYVGAFDLAVCYSCFPHFIDPERAIEVMARALDVKGRLVIGNLVREMEMMSDHNMEIVHRMMSTTDMIALVCRHGFTIRYLQDDSDIFIMIFEKIA